MPHEEDPEIDADEAQARVHDAVPERSGGGQAGHDEEVGAVANDEPRPGADLAEDHAVAQQCPPEFGAPVLVPRSDRRSEPLLLLDPLHHLHPLQLQRLGAPRPSAERFQRRTRLGHPTLVDEVPRTLGHEPEAHAEHHGDHEQRPDGDLVARLVEAALRRVGHHGAHDGPDVDPLGEERDHDGAQVRGTGLGRVDVGEGHQEPVADAQDEPPRVDDGLVGGADLDGAAQRREEAGEEEGRATAAEEGVGELGEEACCEGGEEGA